MYNNICILFNEFLIFLEKKRDNFLLIQSDQNQEPDIALEYISVYDSSNG